MQYPLISEYVRAMQDSAGNLDWLAHLVPVLDDHGEPMRSSGAFAVVFKMKDESTGKEYALKCFTEEQEGRAEAYRQIAGELESVDSTYVTSVKYLEKELFVDCDGDDHEFPVLLMDWIDGETMDHYISESRYDNYAMSMLCYRFCKMDSWLRSQPFAHGDIKPDNIMVRPDGTLTLIDYDGMFVPAMKGQTSPTIGTKGFSHPLRTKDDFDETIDDFALATIALSLKAISLYPSLFDEYASADRLLFSADDYRDLSQSKALAALHPLMTDSELNTLLSLFLLAHATKTLSMVSFRLFSVSKPVYIPEIISTEVTDEDLAEVTKKANGALYSKDGRRLLKVHNVAIPYFRFEDLEDGCICLCDESLEEDYELVDVNIPEGITTLGNRVFYECENLRKVTLPSSIQLIDGNPFVNCACQVVVKSKAYKYENDVLFDSEKKVLIAYLNLEIETYKKYVIPNGITHIGKSAFECSSYISNVKIPNSVTSIGDSAFKDCRDLKSVTIEGVTSIGDSAFESCRYLREIVFKNDVTNIGNEAFQNCAAITNLEIPGSAANIGNGAFSGCRALTTLMIHNGLKNIGDRAFENCSALTDLEIPESITSIGVSSFQGCTSLKKVVIYNGVVSIGAAAFWGCRSLISFTIPYGITFIGNFTFAGCTNLRSIIIPDSVTSIWSAAFSGCCALTSLMLPSSITSIGCYAFEGCVGLTSIVIPEGVTCIEANAFSSLYLEPYN